jgi:hypothetical protein
VELDGPQVDVLVELPSQPEQDLLLQYPRLHLRMADGAEEDCVRGAQYLQVEPGQGLPGPEIPLAAQIERCGLVLEIEGVSGDCDDLHSL